MKKENTNTTLETKKRRKTNTEDAEPPKKKAHTDNTESLDMNKTKSDSIIDGKPSQKARKRRKKNTKQNSTNESLDTNKTKSDSIINGKPSRKARKRGKKNNKQNSTNESDKSSQEDASPVETGPLSQTKEAIAERKLLKKEKKLQRVHNSVDKDANLAIEYLNQWKNDRGNWKFNKNRQVFLTNNFLDTKRIPDSVFPDIVAYFESMKGMARKITRETASLAIALKQKDVCAEDSATSDKDVKTVKEIINRARKIVALLEE